MRSMIGLLPTSTAILLLVACELGSILGGPVGPVFDSTDSQPLIAEPGAMPRFPEGADESSPEEEVHAESHLAGGVGVLQRGERRGTSASLVDRCEPV